MLKINQFADANKASVDTLFGFATQSLQGVEQLVALNLQASKTLLAEFAEGTHAALAAQSPAEVVKLQASALQAAPQKAAAYGHQVKAIFTAAIARQRTAFEAQAADVQAKFLESISAFLKSVPGSESILTQVKSAVTAANNTYGGVNKASKQVTDAVDANFTEVTETAVSSSRNALATIEA